jgi:hypothetical protein
MSAEETTVGKYVVRLSDEERSHLLGLIHKGKHPARKLMRARVLLRADVSESGEAWTDSQIATSLDISTNTVARIRRQLVEEGFEAVLTAKRSPNSSNTKIFDGESEAKLIALACSAPPKGRAKWTLRLLEEKAVELEIVDCVSDNTIGRCLKKTFSNLICRNNGLFRQIAMPLL